MRIAICLCLSILSISLYCQDYPSINYYLPVEEYDSTITTPEEFLGFQVGEWHISHDQLVRYMEIIASESDHMQIETYGYSHEQRPLILITISNANNLANKEVIQQEHLELVNGSETTEVNPNLPAILYQGYSIHGDEASGGNAAMLALYYLAASKSAFVEELLSSVIILFDPCYNPDGFHRFSTWVNSHRSRYLNPDPLGIEFHERWPTGRGNHYWFDLNRDWLLLSHPESRARIALYHKWYPNVLTDHHEMGKNSTFFFQPGVPERTNLLTPQENQKITEDISHYHAQNLDSIGSQYFSKKRFDDYYYGKGSTYPDALGCIGILFEQAGVEGHLQERKDSVISFPFAIRNQVVTSFSSWKATLDMSEQLIDYKRRFFIQVKRDAKADGDRGYFLSQDDPYIINYFKSLLNNHSIKYEEHHAHSIYVPYEQPQYKLLKSMLEPTKEFPDSIFYDVSTWNFPMAYGLQQSTQLQNSKRDVFDIRMLKVGQPIYIPWSQTLIPRLLSSLKLNDQFTIASTTDESFLEYQITHDNLEEIQALLKANLIAPTSLEVSRVSNRSTHSLPKVGLFIGGSLNGYDAGSIWNHFDQVWHYPITLLDINRQSSWQLEKYDVLIMPGKVKSMHPILEQAILTWTQNGGKLIGLKSAMEWAIDQKLVKARILEVDKTGKSQKFVDNQAIGGSIFNAEFDNNTRYRTGISSEEVHTFHRGNKFYLTKSEADVFLRYTQNPVASGFASIQNIPLIRGSAAGIAVPSGEGEYINLMDNPVFRGYWLTGSKLLANVVFLK